MGSARRRDKGSVRIRAEGMLAVLGEARVTLEYAIGPCGRRKKSREVEGCVLGIAMSDGKVQVADEGP